jgi:hypothetical protein
MRALRAHSPAGGMRASPAPSPRMRNPHPDRPGTLAHAVHAQKLCNKKCRHVLLFEASIIRALRAYTPAGGMHASQAPAPALPAAACAPAAHAQHATHAHAVRQMQTTLLAQTAVTSHTLRSRHARQPPAGRGMRASRALPAAACVPAEHTHPAVAACAPTACRPRHARQPSTAGRGMRASRARTASLGASFVSPTIGETNSRVRCPPPCTARTGAGNRTGPQANGAGNRQAAGRPEHGREACSRGGGRRSRRRRSCRRRQP